MMNLTYVAKLGGDVNTITVFAPRLETGGPNALVALEVRHDRLRDFGNVFHEELAVVGLGSHDIALYKLAVANESQADNE